MVGTPTVPALRGSVVRNANVRAGPGVEFAIVGILNAGASVLLEARSGEWYRISGPDDVRGWMSAVVLEIDPATNAAVPQASP
jgi:uncharacterized protein YraI